MDFQGIGECIRGRDFISRLPDDILVQILSRLETKDAVKTCVLSSRWKNLWTFVYNLHFLDNRRNFVNFEIFENFVDRVLGLCQSKDIQDFCLCCRVVYDSEVSHVSQWLCFAVERNVRKLNIRVDAFDIGWRVARLPQSIFTCNTLVELYMLSDFVFDIPDSTSCFPSLKLLYINFTNPDYDLLQKLFHSCPVLEDLSIHGVLVSDEAVLTFDIMMPTLKRLTIRLYLDSGYFEGVSKHKFVVTASNLEYLVIQDYILVNFVVNGRHLLNEVSLDVGVDILLIKDYSQRLDELEVSHDEANQVMKLLFEVSRDEANRVMKLLRGVNYTKILSLTSNTMNSLNLGFDDNMPTFPNLIHLEMCIEARFGWKLLPHFLNSSSNLEVLILKMDCNQEYSSEKFVEFESESVPSCLRLHVKTIEIRNMTGGEDELEVISYMLKNSEVLEEFSVDIAAIAVSKENLRRQILMYPRVSVACEIKFL
ncbi:hypothetical protein Dsin_007361 [Dipteronia sinensis]|uniref:F-box domain-containing protein n=1 Tax=Dipteronia sinensis TaxID=43782 RepID=A0AAE0EGS2_9ROSI|nr:hypothetical protein Dsin_007361 [Dipteronia sinensis]